MTKLFSFAIATFLTLSCAIAQAQTPVEIAKDMGTRAIKLEDDGKYDEALILLAEAQKLDPTNKTYPYEIAYSYMGQKQYQKAIDVLEKLKDWPTSFDQVYQLLGNSYDYLNEHDRAVSAYEEGLEKFPNSGRLYYERGVVLEEKVDYNRALSSFEKGIKVQPDYALNYYGAAKLYFKSDDPMWGMIYGEIFMNLERGSGRTETMSKLLFDTYKSKIQFSGSGKISVSFSKSLIFDTGGSAKIAVPSSSIYEPTMKLAAASETSININSADRIRRNFLRFYMQRFINDYPNALFSYQGTINRAGHLEAYNHWLLMKGDDDGFNTWKAANETKWDNFIEWFKANPLTLNDNNHFYRTQY